MKPDQVKFRRAPQTNFLIMDEEVFDKLSPYALKVYGQLRKLTSYTQQNDEIEITVKNLAKASGISERKTYDVLNELEHTHYIIQRHNIYHFRFGQINSFDVSQTYGFYKPAQEPVQEPVQEPDSTAPSAPPVDNYGQNLSPPAQYAVPPAQYADLKKQESSHEVFKKKQNKNPVIPLVSVFSDHETVKNHLTQVIANRKIFVEDDTMNQGIYYAYEKNKDKSFDSVNKKLNIFLKKLSEGQWNIPQNYNGISSQSIREKEEREHKAKQEQYKQEAKAAQNAFSAVVQGEGLKAFSDMFKKLKDETNDQDADSKGMQKRAV